MNNFEVELIRIRTLSSSTKDFRFKSALAGDVAFTPGQFFRFVFEDADGEFERSYSLCNFEGERGVMDLMISTVDGGRASKLLFDTDVGLKAKVTGPFGRLVLPKEPPDRLFLVATSVGMAPFMSMLEALAAWASTEVHLLYGIRDAGEFVYGSELTKFSEAHSHINLSVCISREEPGDGQFKGYVQDRLFALSPNPKTDHILLCGNPKMIDDVYPELKTMGFGVRQIVREKYVFAKDKNTSDAKVMNDAQKKLLAEKMKKYQS